MDLLEELSIAELEADAAAQVPVPDDSTLKRIAELADEQERLEELEILKTRELEDLKKELAIIRKLLPEVMKGAGLAEFKLVNGHEVGVKTNYYASISEKNSEEAFQWLTKTGNEAIIKATLSMNFDRGDFDKAVQAAKTIEDKTGLRLDVGRSVNPQTLKAFVKEQMKNKVDIPEKTFGIHTETISVVKKGKKGKNE